MSTTTLTSDAKPATGAAALSGASSPAATSARPSSFPRIPFTRLVAIELRKMFDTRSGFWLMMSIGILAVIATAGVVIFAASDQITYGTFSAAIGIPMSILLPVVAILSITSEWSQRTGLTTFSMVPHRGSGLRRDHPAAVVVGVVSMLHAGSAIEGVDTVWDVTWTNLGTIIVANILGMAVGFMLGTVLRNSAAAVAAYFVYAFVLPTISGILIATQQWYRDAARWIDFNGNQTRLYDSGVTGSDWGYLAVTAGYWLVIPLAIGIAMVLRSEVK